jgi:uncharacterized protein (DUF1778 family)
LDFSLPIEVKEKIERAAIISGITVTDFAINALVNSADSVLEKHQNRVLSARDRDLFLAMLDSDQEPNEDLKKASKAHEQLIVED